jgi:hypothetical protein
MFKNATQDTKETGLSEHNETLGSLFHREGSPLASDQNPLQD